MTLTPVHVQKAFQVIRLKGIAPNRPSTKWDIIDPETKEPFPPKAVLRLAKKLAGDKTYTGSGGKATNGPLRALGFNVSLKSTLEESDEAADIKAIMESALGERIKQRLVSARLGQGTFREQLLKFWNERCPITDCDIKAVLRASHIKAWRDSDDNEKLDPANGILLAASVDALFDKYLITFSKEGSILANGHIAKGALKKLGVPAGKQLALEVQTQEYLESHRREFKRASAGQWYVV